MVELLHEAIPSLKTLFLQNLSAFWIQFVDTVEVFLVNAHEYRALVINGFDYKVRLQRKEQLVVSKERVLRQLQKRVNHLWIPELNSSCGYEK